MLLHILAFFNPKIRKFVKGRKNGISHLKKAIPAGSPIVWIHAASLGEFEQGLPVMELLKTTYPEYKIVLTFFSPSGYEVRKNTAIADVVTYLPLDSRWNAKAFIRTVKPKLVLFVKYEVWPNYLKELNKQKIPVLLISAIFHKRQTYFKWYGGFMRKSLNRFSHIFVQNESSRIRLSDIDITGVTVNGDTRFDRVSQIREQDNYLDFMEKMKGNSLCLVAGSTWREDEELLIKYTDSHEGNLKIVIAPHDVKTEHIKQLRGQLKGKSVLYSEMEGTELSEAQILIIDTVGLLTKIYSYADIAYVGGGFATGLHNTLEPAVFGIPVIIGPDYQNFQEALDLVHEKGVLVVNNETDFAQTLDQLLQDQEYRRNTGLINSNYISRKRGASIQIMHHVRTLL